MTFVAWVALVVAAICETVPDAKAVRRGRTALISHGDRAVRIEQRGDTIWCFAGDGGPQGFTLAGDVHTGSTARNAGRSLANHLRAATTKPSGRAP